MGVTRKYDTDQYKKEEIVKLSESVRVSRASSLNYHVNN